MESGPGEITYAGSNVPSACFVVPRSLRGIFLETCSSTMWKTLLNGEIWVSV